MKKNLSHVQTCVKKVEVSDFSLAKIEAKTKWNNTFFQQNQNVEMVSGFSLGK